MGLQITVKTRSGRSLRQTFNKFANSARKAGEHELLREASEILTATEPLVPLLTGALRGTGRIKGPFRQGNKSSIFIAYGNQTVTYAHTRHEIEARQYTTPGTGIKYLTGPFQKFKPGMPKRVQSGIIKRVGSRGINVR